MTLAELLRQRGTPVDLPCGGGGRCGKCRVIAHGDVDAPGERERALLTPDELAQGVRLACLAQALSEDVTVEPVSARGTDSIQTAGQMPEIILSHKSESGAGLAVDIGTTTVAAYLYRLSDGAKLAEAAEKNPQGAFGADVTSRIDRALAGESAALAQAIRGCIARLLTVLCEKSGVSQSAVTRATLTGNTAMLYFLTGRNPGSIAVAPFDADCLFGQTVPGESIGLPGMAVYLPGCVGAYVGADITCAMLAAGFDRPAQKPRLLVDIGTNGEMALDTGDALLCCSTAAGPALEGAGISCGMTARTGAIHRVRVVGGEITCDVIGGGEALGICGSGLLDAVAALLETEALDDTGRFEDGEDVTLPGTNVVLTQRDIRQVQLAKSAICSGVKTLIKRAGIAESALGEVLIAGGFGTAMNPISAGRIGLLPEGLAARAQAIGNAAGMGAAMMLLSDEAVQAGEQLCRKARVIDLATDPVFQNAFIEEMMFPV